jgi:hypothetical protein
MTAIRSRGAALSLASAFAVDARNPDDLMAQRRLKGAAVVKHIRRGFLVLPLSALRHSNQQLGLAFRQWLAVSA